MALCIESELNGLRFPDHLCITLAMLARHVTRIGTSSAPMLCAFCEEKMALANDSLHSC